jgi:hypothetical protein
VRFDLGAWTPWFAILSASSWLIALIAISLFFAIGQPWGTINDVASVVQWAAAIPLVIVIYQSQRAYAPIAQFVAPLGLAALIVSCALTVLLIAQVLTFQQQGTPTAIAGGVFGLWLVATAAVWLGASPLPWPLLALMAVAGSGTVAGIVGFVGFGSSHWLTYAGGTVGGLAYPAWGYWLAILLLRSPDLLTRSR